MQSNYIGLFVEKKGQLYLRNSFIRAAYKTEEKLLEAIASAQSGWYQVDPMSHYLTRPFDFVSGGGWKIQTS